ncbi:VRR-NUC domain-containing protein [Desulfoscipio gibsoniae]|uniref:VRR-NUC domain-containing protein n=1 Tax=Desulfoscipio gibsoniae DSM 7213 TaxID=767817 RepID=R4KSR0_9FIRM|nr:VRR-NUC domain-containing protein [Desulfoscipio gibsoniae]AGL03625.1 VRR-NUC domain-containing protein [Desulfoscipio gibsoniae DSM 7213]HHX24824.1 VRR-NUC domain-containing protein [Thermoanaerobacterales bacterium]
MTEKQLQKKVIKYLNSLPNTWFFKVWGGGFQRSGIPDLICCINGLFVALELKGTGGKSTKLQELNINNINAAGGIGLILYPADFKEFKTLVKEVSNGCGLATAELNALKNAGTNSCSDTSET